MSSFRLVLFVLGDAPRSRRARANLKACLEELGCADNVPIEEVDLIEEPERGLTHDIVSAPAVACVAEDGQQEILYGDLGTEAGAAYCSSTWLGRPSDSGSNSFRNSRVAVYPVSSARRLTP